MTLRPLPIRTFAFWGMQMFLFLYALSLTVNYQPVKLFIRNSPILHCIKSTWLNIDRFTILKFTLT